MASEKMLVGRHKRVAFMDADGSGKTFTRMTGFTSLSDGKNSTEYSRQYVDEASERSDVVGYAPAIDYEFDRYTNDPVHEKIAAITDDEILGTEAQVDIVVVDLFEQKTSETTCTARKRTWSVIPDTEGDGTDALIYSFLYGPNRFLHAFGSVIQLWKDMAMHITDSCCHSCCLHPESALSSDVSSHICPKTVRCF